MVSTSLTAINDAVLASVKKAFPAINVYSYDEACFDDSSVSTPACLFELSEINFGSDRGDGRYPAECEFFIHCVIGYKNSSQENSISKEVREFAAAIAQHVWNSGIWVEGGVLDRPARIQISPGNFRHLSEHGYESWIVEWDQTVYLGRSFWNADGIRPVEVAFSARGDGYAELSGI
ncbi:hypothetical protein [Zooshikella sp. RANM57]|uniref:hypothetical protein n=1 Tax=Zooshikella sp. RANM57 TaxID=3425863 RepID=UPI003D6FF320